MAPSKSGRARSSMDSHRYCGQVSANTFCPASRAAATASSACRADRCTMYSGQSGHLGQGDGPRGGLALQLRRPGQAVLDRVCAAGRQRLRDQLVDGDAVLRVHHHGRAGTGRLLHGQQDLAVGRVEHAGVGHEHLEAVHPGLDAGVHLLERRVVDVGDDHVEAVVDRAVAVRLGVPLVQRGQQRGALGLDGEVDDRGGAAPGRGAGAGLEGVRGERAAERHLHVRVRVDPAGQHVLAGRVDDLVRRRRGRGLPRPARRSGPWPAPRRSSPRPPARRRPASPTP